MKRQSTAFRLSLSLAALSISVLLAAHTLGLVPDAGRLAVKGRMDLCQSLAITCSAAAQRGDTSAIANAAAALMQRDPDILSVGMRQVDGMLIAHTPDHEALWNSEEQVSEGRSNATHVQVPIFRNNVPWGSIEVRFKPVLGSGPWAFMKNPVFRLALFMAGAGFLAFLVYLRRTLKYLDPSAVIPERVKAMLDTLAEGVLVLDQRERIVLANDAFAALVAQDAGSLVGKNASELAWLAPDGESHPKSYPWTDSLKDSVTRKGAALCLRRAEEKRALTLNCAPIHGVNGSTRGVLLTFDDVTLIEQTNAQLRETLTKLETSQAEIERQNVELHALATTDPLTGCRNRRSFYPELQGQWSKAQRYGHAVAIIMVDVDYFKKINDKYGHSAGDQVLQGVSKILRTLARDSDVVCRYGGEEFCILLPHTDVTAAARAAERYRAMIESERCGAVAVTASLGVSAMHLGAKDPQEILDQADKALYAAKRTGRNRVVRWDEMPADVPVEAKPAEPVREEPKPAVAAAAAVVARPISFHAVTALMSALSHRDKPTAEHSQFVADLCVHVGRDLMSVRDCFLMEIAALMHDIGKLGVPDHILLKPGPLTEAEWSVMRTHEQMGVEILSAAFGSKQLAEIVACHHHWFAGSPAGQSAPCGGKIPLAARLLSIADAFDAIVSNRPYRKGRSIEEAFAELRRAAGSQFDPELVERFIKMMVISPPPIRPHTSARKEDTAIRIRMDLEKLAVAADCHDLAAVTEAARELAEAVAGTPGLSEQVATLQKVLDSTIAGEPDLQKVLALTQELQHLVRSVSAGGGAVPVESTQSPTADASVSTVSV